MTLVTLVTAVEHARWANKATGGMPTCFTLQWVQAKAALEALAGSGHIRLLLCIPEAQLSEGC